MKTDGFMYCPECGQHAPLIEDNLDEMIYECKCAELTEIVRWHFVAGGHFLIEHTGLDPAKDNKTETKEVLK